MKNKTIKIKLLLAGSLLVLCISIGVAVNDQVRTNLTDTLFGQEEDAGQTHAQTRERWISSSETETAEAAALAKGKSEEGGLTSSISTDSLTNLGSEEYIAYLAEQQGDGSAASRGGAIREEQKQNTVSQFSDQSDAAIDDKIATSQENSETAQMPSLKQEDSDAQKADEANTYVNDQNTNVEDKKLESTTGASAGNPDDAASGYKNEKEDNAPEDRELDLLARLITAEAQGEPYEAQVAVGAVVLNRVKSGAWPGSVEGVIYQNIGGYYQFTPVVNGWIDKPAKESSIKAAKAALRGEDPTNGAQFYYDDTTTNEWILSKTVSVTIGRMIFAF
ncbi:MAG: hypothetical protein K0Q48_819 [Bacillota bacterium]|jgi:spore germination cell wall hydrolase CwlJ-like protein|nr:hypothetical protein [Bacillota bacterium]